MANLSYSAKSAYAMLVGIGDYKNEKFPAVSGANLNVDRMRSVLTGPNFGFPADNITQFRGSSTDEFFDSLESILSRKPSLFVFYFCGHAIPAKKDKNLLLALARSNPAAERTLIGIADIASDLKFQAPGLGFLILDCCFGAMAFDHLGPSEEIDLSLRELDAAGDEVRGLYAIAAGNRYETVRQIDRVSAHTPFSRALLNVMEYGIPDNRNEALSLDDIFSGIRSELKGEPAADKDRTTIPRKHDRLENPPGPGGFFVCKNAALNALYMGELNDLKKKNRELEDELRYLKKRSAAPTQADEEKVFMNFAPLATRLPATVVKWRRGDGGSARIIALNSEANRFFGQTSNSRTMVNKTLDQIMEIIDPWIDRKEKEYLVRDQVGVWKMLSSGALVTASVPVIFSRHHPSDNHKERSYIPVVLAQQIISVTVVDEESNGTLDEKFPEEVLFIMYLPTTMLPDVVKYRPSRVAKAKKLLLNAPDYRQQIRELSTAVHLDVDEMLGLLLSANGVTVEEEAAGRLVAMIDPESSDDHQS